jgi:pimeloyl-ACP methyl ester carboxylesterase
MVAAAASLLLVGSAHAQAVPKAKNVVLVHGLFADGSCWSEVIPRLQAAGLNVTSVQNPLTTLPDAVASALQVLARQDGPTVLAGHSFSGMIVTEAGVHPNVSAIVYVAARAPDAGEDYTALAKKFPTPPASAGIMFDGDEGRLSEEAFLRDFAGDLPEAKARALYAVPESMELRFTWVAEEAAGARSIALRDARADHSCDLYRSKDELPRGDSHRLFRVIHEGPAN